MGYISTPFQIIFYGNVLISNSSFVYTILIICGIISPLLITYTFVPGYILLSTIYFALCPATHLTSDYNNYTGSMFITGT